MTLHPYKFIATNNRRWRDWLKDLDQTQRIMEERGGRMKSL